MRLQLCVAARFRALAGQSSVEHRDAYIDVWVVWECGGIHPHWGTLFEDPTGASGRPKQLRSYLRAPKAAPSRICACACLF